MASFARELQIAQQKAEEKALIAATRSPPARENIDSEIEAARQQLEAAKQRLADYNARTYARSRDQTRYGPAGSKGARHRSRVASQQASMARLKYGTAVNAARQRLNLLLQAKQTPDQTASQVFEAARKEGYETIRGQPKTPQNVAGYNPYTGKMEMGYGSAKTGYLVSTSEFEEKKRQEEAASRAGYVDTARVDPRAAVLEPVREGGLFDMDTTAEPSARIKAAFKQAGFEPAPEPPAVTPQSPRGGAKLKFETEKTVAPPSFYGIELTETLGGVRAAPGKTINLFEGAPPEPRQLSQEQVNALSASEYANYLREYDVYNAYVNFQEKQYLKTIKTWVADVKKDGVNTVTITTNGVTRQVPISRAYAEYTAALKTDPNATLKAPVGVLPLTENLGLRSGELSQTAFFQDPEGKLRTLISTSRPPKPTFNLYGFQPLSIIPEKGDKESLARTSTLKGLGLLGGQRDLLTVDFKPERELPRRTSPVTDALDKLTGLVERGAKKIEDSSIGGQIVAEFGRHVYATIPFAIETAQTYIAQPAEELVRKQSTVPVETPRVPETFSGLGIGTLTKGAYEQVLASEGIKVNATEPIEALIQGKADLESYVEKHGYGAIVGSGLATVLPIPGGKIGKLSSGLKAKVSSFVTKVSKTKPAGNLPAEMRPTGALTSLNTLYREPPRVANIAKESLAKLKEETVAKNVIRRKMAELAGLGAEKTIMRYDPATERVDRILTQVGLGKGETFTTSGKGFGGGKPPSLPPGGTPTLTVIREGDIISKPPTAFSSTLAGLGVGTVTRGPIKVLSAEEDLVKFITRQVKVAEHATALDLRPSRELSAFDKLFPFKAKIKLGKGKQILPVKGKFTSQTINLGKDELGIAKQELPQLKIKNIPSDLKVKAKNIFEKKTKGTKITSKKTIKNAPQPKWVGQLPKNTRLQKRKPASLNTLYREPPRVANIAKESLAKLKEQNIAKNIIQAKQSDLKQLGVEQSAIRYNPETQKIDYIFSKMGLGKGKGFNVGKVKLIKPSYTIPKATFTSTLIKLGTGKAPTEITTAAKVPPILKVTRTAPKPTIEKATAKPRGAPLLLLSKTETKQEPATVVTLDVEQAAVQRLKNLGFTETKVSLGTTLPQKQRSMTGVVAIQKTAEKTRLRTATIQTPQEAQRTAVAVITRPKSAQRQKVVPVIIPRQKQRPKVTPILIPRTTPKITPKTTPRTVPAITPIITPIVTPKLVPDIPRPPRFPPPPPLLFPPTRRPGRERRAKLEGERADFLGSSRVAEITGFRSKVDITYGLALTEKLARQDVRKTGKRYGIFSKKKGGSLLVRSKPSFRKETKAKVPRF